MNSMIKVEIKRILKIEILFAFFAAVLLLSVSSSYWAVKEYELWDMDGFVASAEENIKHGKENADRIPIEEAIVSLKGKQETVYLDETNVEKLVMLNYPDKDVSSLTQREIDLFLENRIDLIGQRLNESDHFSYTEAEKEHVLKEAGKLTNLTVGFAEGWKVLNRDMGSFLPFVLIMLSIMIMPLFADGDQTRMKELIQSTRKGKKQLDLGRIAAAFAAGGILYVSAILLFFLVKIIPFGAAGGKEYIQSSEDTFFSAFHISYIEQFLWNCMRGYAALILAISTTLLISVMLERIMAGMAVVCFYWMLLYIMEKMMSFEVNHLIANFMPLRLSGSTDIYVQNEIYRFAGKTFAGIVWCPVVALMLSGIMLGISVWWRHRKTVHWSICRTRKYQFFTMQKRKQVL